MKDPKFSPIIAEIERVFGLEGVRVTWTDGRVFEFRDGKWKFVEKSG